MAYGRVRWISPPPPSSSMWNLDTTTVSVGLTMLANCGLISELRYSKLSASTGAQASDIAANSSVSMIWMTRFSVGVKSRPSMRAWKRPSPPKKLSITVKTRRGSITTSAVPRSGLMRTRLRLLGTARPCTYSANLSIFTPSTDTSQVLRSTPKTALRKKRAKRSLTISRVGRRPRTMRSCCVKSYEMTASGGNGSSLPVSTAPPSTPLIRASISSCESRSLIAGFPLLHDEAGEVQRFHARAAQALLDDLAHRFQRLRLQFLLAGGVAENGVVLAAEQHDQRVADDRIGLLGGSQRGGIVRHQAHADLQEAHGLVVLEVDDERRIQREVLLLLGHHHLGLFRGGAVPAARIHHEVA